MAEPGREQALPARAPSREEALRGSPFGELLRAVAKGEVTLYQDEPCPWLSYAGALGQEDPGETRAGCRTWAPEGTQAS